MKKVIIAAMAVALSAGVNAQTEGGIAGTTGVAGIGGLTIPTITAIGVSAAVAAAIVSANSGTTLVEGQKFELTCATGFTGPVDGVCTGSATTTATATASVGGTVTNTVTVVPVTVTQPAIVTPVQ